MSEPAAMPDEHAPPQNQPSLSDWANIIPDQAAAEHQTDHEVANDPAAVTADATKADTEAAKPAAAVAAAETEPDMAPAAASAAAVQSKGHLVKEGDTVILDVNRERYSFVHIKRGGKVRVGKKDCSMDTFIGAPYGAVYELDDDGKTLRRCARDGAEEWSEHVATERNNAQLVDRGTANQALGHAEIEALKASGASGTDIMAALATGSTTFAGKTEFSQAKYRKRKAKKYLTFASLQRPTARAICEVYFNKMPHKTHHLRVDSLAIMLSLANVAAHAKVLVLDACCGLVTGAVTERLGGHGIVCAAYPGDKPPSYDAVRLFNFTDTTRTAMCHAPLTAVEAAFGLHAEATTQQQAEPQQHQANGPVAPPEATATVADAALANAAAAEAAAPNAAAAAAAAAVQNLSAVIAGSRPTADPAAAATSAAIAVAARASGGGPQNGPEPDAPGTAAADCGAAGPQPMDADVNPAAGAGAGAEPLQQQQQQQQQQAELVTKAETVLPPQPGGVDASGANHAGVPVAADAAEWSGDAASIPAERSATTSGPAASGGPDSAAGQAASQQQEPQQRQAQPQKPQQRPPKVQHSQQRVPQGVPRVAAGRLEGIAQAGGFDSAVVAAPTLLPAVVLARVLPLLAPSAPFVVWHPHSQPLADAMAGLQQRKEAVGMQLQESWWRELQVLPARTHPTMSTPGTGGYLLSGTKVVIPEATAPGGTAVPTSKRQRQQS